MSSVCSDSGFCCGDMYNNTAALSVVIICYSLCICRKSSDYQKAGDGSPNPMTQTIVRGVRSTKANQRNLAPRPPPELVLKNLMQKKR